MSAAHASVLEVSDGDHRMDRDEEMWIMCDMWSDLSTGVNNHYIKIAVFSLIVSFAVTGHL